MHFRFAFTQQAAILTRLIAMLMITIFCGLKVQAFDIDQHILAQVKARFGEAAAERILAWQRLARDNTKLMPQQKLEKVNDFFNQIRFISDLEHWQREDYWATPIEMLATDGADCEDYAIAKYFTLRELGIPDEQLKITYVKALQLNQAHMVLAFYPSPGAEPLILDNLINDILPASERLDLAPVYSFNGEGLWLSKLSSQEGKRIGEASKLKNWQDNLTRHNRLFK
jgi:predicted transglutaminase-like cysteine proteinase